MAGTSLLTLIDDIASMLDDVAVLTKIAAKKTSGVLGDDLALNAQQVAGVAAERELPVVWAVAKGSAVNKLILVPAALLISQLVPWLVTPLLMLGGLFLCFEGFEKVFEKFFHTKPADTVEKTVQRLTSDTDLVKFEKEKIKGAIRTDFILSAEIVVITLGTVAAESLTRQFGVLVGISAIMTIGVYGLVAGIVKLDDAGVVLSAEHRSGTVKKIGRFLLAFAPYLMKALGIIGTIAMFLVGGGILTHGIPYLHHLQEGMATGLPLLMDLAAGIAAGGLVFVLLKLARRFVWKKS